MYKDHLQSCTKIREYIEDEGLPAPPRGSSEELQHSDYLQMQKYFTLALLVLLVTNMMSDLVIEIFTLVASILK